MSVDLSISGGNIDSNCKNVVTLLQRYNIIGKVSSNKSVMPDGTIENGCTIRLSRKLGDEDNSGLKKNWEILKSNLNLDCAHLLIFGKFDGCLFDYIRDTNCPGDKISAKVKNDGDYFYS